MRRVHRPSRLLHSPLWLGAAIAGALVGASVLGGGCTGDFGSSFGADTPPCQGALAGQCGELCATDGDCALGLFCESGRCTAECTPLGTQCPPFTACDARGRCVEASGAGGNGSGGVDFTNGVSTSTGQGGSCGTIAITFEPQTPTVVLLIDQSGSMTELFGGQSRWDAVYDALMDPADGVITALEGEVRFGLALYTFVGANNDPTCPTIVDVLPPTESNRAAIDAVYATQGPSGNTPTGDSIDAIVPGLVAFAEPGPKLIILATDGEPDRCANLDGHDQISRDLATTAAANAYSQGIETVIIAVGNAVSQTHQQDMANAGAGLVVPAPALCADPMTFDPTQCAPTFEPATKQAMIDAFTAIINGQRTCVFDLDGEVIPGKECDGVVTLNATPIPCNDADGWKLNSGTQIEFVGAACETILQDPGVIISAEFPCESVAEPPQ